jgi:hypothetical protein
VATYNVSYEWSIAEQPDEFHQYAEHRLSDVPDNLSGKFLIEYIEKRVKENAPLVAHVRNLTIHS